MKDTKAHLPPPNLFRTMGKPWHIQPCTHTAFLLCILPYPTGLWPFTGGDLTHCSFVLLFMPAQYLEQSQDLRQTKIYIACASCSMVLDTALTHNTVISNYTTILTATTCQALCTFVYLEKHWRKSSLLQIPHLNSRLLPGTLQYLSLYHSLPLYSFPL